MLVEVEGSEVLGEPKFIETDAVRWLSADVQAERFKNAQELIEGLIAECRNLQELAEGRPVMARLVVRGRSHLYREFRRTGYLAGLEEEVRSQTADFNPFVELAALDFSVKPALDLDALQSAPDFLGELLRGAQGFTKEDCDAAWEALVEDRNLNRFKLRSAIESLDWEDVALQASYLCADLLSPGEPRMRIDSFHIDGFGVFQNTGLEELTPKLSVFCGPNESGKSTFLAFLRFMFFGLPDKRTKANRYPPLRSRSLRPRRAIGPNDLWR